MKTITETRTVIIDIDSLVLVDYLMDIKHLPLWSHFYSELVESISKNSGKMITIIGPCTTELSVQSLQEQTLITIESDFGSKIEKASITIQEASGCVELSFYLNIPESIDPQKRIYLLLNLESELKALKENMGKVYER